MSSIIRTTSGPDAATEEPPSPSTQTQPPPTSDQAQPLTVTKQPRPGWSKRQHRIFALTAITVAMLLAAATLLTTIEQILRGALVALLGFAFWPIVLLGAVLLVGLVAMLFIALVTQDASEAIGDELTEAGGSLLIEHVIPWYYRLLARQRHPVFWGIPAGALLGIFLLWGYIAWVIAPPEMATMDTLVSAAARVESRYAQAGRYPHAQAGGTLTNTSTDSAYRDAFGRPLRYTERGAWKLRSYEIRSLGHDGVPSADDLCVSGATKAAGALDAAVRLAADSSTSAGAEQGPATRWRALSMSRCDNAKRMMNR